LDLSMVDRRLHDDLRKIYLHLKAPRFDLHRPLMADSGILQTGYTPQLNSGLDLFALPSPPPFPLLPAIPLPFPQPPPSCIHLHTPHIRPVHPLNAPHHQLPPPLRRDLRHNI
jgi:hypothetical protein